MQTVNSGGPHKTSLWTSEQSCTVMKWPWNLMAVFRACYSILIYYKVS